MAEEGRSWTPDVPSVAKCSNGRLKAFEADMCDLGLGTERVSDEFLRW